MEQQLEDLIDLDRFENDLDTLRVTYAGAAPYPHIVLDDVLKPEALNSAYTELANLDLSEWTNYLHVNERKYSNTKVDTWGTTLQSLSEAFTSPRFVAFLAELTGFPTLQPDPSMDGGGLHRSVAGGFLNVHADFTAHHTHPNWQRRVNLLLYLNPEWEQAWGGELELWATDMSACVAKVAPIGNRILLFTTNEDSYHGHPEPLRFPDGTARQSMALYYFTEESDLVVKATNYRARPGDGLKSVAIYLDKQALRFYDVLKRKLKISDKAVSSVLGKISRIGRRKK